MKRKRKVVKKIITKKIKKIRIPPNHIYPIIDKPCDRDNDKVTNNIFYHMFCVNDALDRFDRTYKKITLSGLINKIDDIYVNCVGPEKIKISDQLIKYNNVKVNIGNHDKGEAETLNLLRDFSIKNPHGNVLYLHSKGVSKQRWHNQKCINQWVDCMEYFLIEEHEKCLELLKEYDNCGINYLKFSGWAWKKFRFIHSSHYSGNFWWCRNSYILRRPACQENNRWFAEMVFLQPALSKYINLYQTKGCVSPYFHENPRSSYTTKDSLI